ncbi:MAG: acyl-[acyl-carrier-protein] thioesterase [Muricoprocola sp.]
MKYEFKDRVRYSEIGEDGKLTYANVVNYFQDCSTFQSEILGNTMEEMKKRKRAWIMAYWIIEFFRRPALGEEITIQTWPHSFRGFQGGRNYQMLDVQGEVLARADSLWVYLDTETGHPVRTEQEVIDCYGMDEALDMEKTSRKVQIPEENEEKPGFCIHRYHLDTNHHVNNAKYIAMAEEYLPEGFEASKIRVEYKKSAKRENIIVPLVHVTEEKTTVTLCDEEKRPYAVLEFGR